MAMTGKQHDTQEAVSISEGLEEQLLKRLYPWAHDPEKDLEFYSCSDGIVIKVPTKPIMVDGSPDPRSPLIAVLNFMTRHFGEGTLLVDLASIHASGTALGVLRGAKVKELWGEVGASE